MIKSTIKNILRTKTIGRCAQFVLDVNRNENNCNMETNGEFAVEKEYIHDNDVIFDVGANIGDWSSHCLALAPNAQIHAFEPVKKTFELLNDRGFPSKVKLNNFALGDREEDKTIMHYGDDHGYSSFYKQNYSKGKVVGMEIAHMMTLDTYCENNNISRIDFLKIDVEGHEHSVLRGAKNMIARRAIKAIQFEYGQTYIEARAYLKDILNLFNEKDYIACKLFPDGPREISYTYDLENMRYANYFILRKDAANKQL